MTSGQGGSNPFYGMRVALIAVLVGAIGSVALTIYAGRDNLHTHPMLLVLFGGWVLSPFVVLALAAVASRRWLLQTRTALHGSMVVVAVASLAVYGYVSVALPKPKVAVFVLVPPVSWRVFAAVLLAAALVARRHPRS